MHSSSYDVVIVGAGMIGSTLALALAGQTDLTIAIIDKAPAFTSWMPTASYQRVSAITLASQRIFKALGVWDAMTAMRVSPFQQIKVWDKQETKLEFNCRELGESVLGHIIENSVIESALLAKLAEFSQVKRFTSVTLNQVEISETEAVLTSEQGDRWSAPLVVAADGATSWLRKHVGIDVAVHDYQEAGIVATVSTTKPHHGVASQRFLATGPLAFLPLIEPNHYSIVWTLPKEQAAQTAALSDAAFQAALSEAMAGYVSEIIHVNARQLFPLRQMQATQYVKPRVALVGDAAHVVHPLAGQGVNIGLLDAASLAELMIAALQQGREPTSFSLLRRYERWRRADNLAMITGIDAIKKIFLWDKPLLNGLRRLGMQLTHQMPWLKKMSSTQAVGNRSGLPRLAREI